MLGAPRSGLRRIVSTASEAFANGRSLSLAVLIQSEQGRRRQALTFPVKEREDEHKRRAADGPGHVQPNDAGAKHDETQCHRLLPSDAITKDALVLWGVFEIIDCYLPLRRQHANNSA